MIHALHLVNKNEATSIVINLQQLSTEAVQCCFE